MDEMNWLDYLLQGIAALVIAALIAWAIADMARKAAAVTLCATALVLITGILYSAFTLSVNTILSGATSTLAGINTESGGKLYLIAAAVMPDNLVTCMAIVFSMMVSRLIYDWNVEFITRICS